MYVLRYRVTNRYCSKKLSSLLFFFFFIPLLLLLRDYTMNAIARIPPPPPARYGICYLRVGRFSSVDNNYNNNNNNKNNITVRLSDYRSLCVGTIIFINVIINTHHARIEIISVFFFVSGFTITFILIFTRIVLRMAVRNFSWFFFCFSLIYYIFTCTRNLSRMPFWYDDDLCRKLFNTFIIRHGLLLLLLSSSFFFSPSLPLQPPPPNKFDFPSPR